MFQIDHFKITAEELPCLNYINKDIAEAVSRTTIGRYYYYIFLKYRETIYHALTVDGKNQMKSQRRNIHYLIQKIMANYYRTDISGKLKYLRDVRNLCDYELDAIIDKNTINKAKLIVFYLEREITSIKAGAQLNNAFIKALKDIKHPIK
ncbi:hypothetical protein [Candidatus Magnetominusculus dajiuhuensis]|uniref:hypothetical protein n=1 Tax=Candidatus Magnetominusculus dajiuhuensis TaxID=3137712 RepID=UPI003B42D495